MRVRWHALAVTDRPPDDLVVRYSWVSLTAWIFVSLIGLAASVGAVASTDRDFGDIAAGVVGGPPAVVTLAYLVAKLFRGKPRYVIGSAGFEDHRASDRVFVPWHAVSGVSTGRRSRAVAASSCP